jgi:hypothetical protein
MSIIDDIRENMRPSTTIEKLVNKEADNERNHDTKGQDHLRQEIEKQMQADYLKARSRKPVQESALYVFDDGSTARLDIENGDRKTLRGTFSTPTKDGKIVQTANSYFGVLGKLGQMKKNHNLHDEFEVRTFNDGTSLQEIIVIPDNHEGAMSAWKLDLGHGVQEQQVHLNGCSSSEVNIDRFFHRQSFADHECPRPLPLV